MTLQSDITWKQMDLANQGSISHQLARYALALRYELLPSEVVHEAKRCLLDALGCAIGAWEAPGRSICEDLVRTIGGSREATLFGSGEKTSALNATLFNSFLVRFLDFNDLGGGGHNSDAIPALLAVAEVENRNGCDFITSLVCSYEIGARVGESVKTSTWQEKDWKTDVRGGLNMPPSLGRLLGLTEEQIANAVGICASHSLPLGILDAQREENTMAKNLRFGFISHHAILSCMLAKRGFTGPLRVVEGETGFKQVILQGDMDLEKLTDFSGWRILRTKHKALAADSPLQGIIFATLAVVKENDIRPEEVASVRLKAGHRAWQHTTSLVRKYPRNAETADHSVYFANAVAIKERSFGPESIEPQKFRDPVILDLIEKITVEPDPTVAYAGGVSEISLRDGRRFEKRVEVAHGFGDVSLSDSDIENKFRGMAAHHMSSNQIQSILEMVWSAEKLDNLSKLTGLMAFK
ncbi:MAG: MmgE/PrpD family protein [Chloroflexi bacterium]|nr:MmgE/PrpD family protein [Chloroflexota bacterium]